jgi:hypothetical protein
MNRTISVGLFFLLPLTASVPPLLAYLPPTTQPASVSLFDPARHMRVSEVRPGMKGYGLSVFLGTKIERFDVEVISILKNFNPKTDVVLIKFGGDNLEHNLAIAGMSGSPIYLYDDTGKARMIGAFAYGWQLQKDPIAGVQPIEYMLKLPDQMGSPTSQPSGSETVQVPLNHGAASGESMERKLTGGRWSLSDSVLLPGMKSAPPAGGFWKHDTESADVWLGRGFEIDAAGNADDGRRIVPAGVEGNGTAVPCLWNDAGAGRWKRRKQ